MWPLSLFLIQWLMDWSMIKSKLIYKKNEYITLQINRMTSFQMPGNVLTKLCFAWWAIPLHPALFCPIAQHAIRVTIALHWSDFRTPSYNYYGILLCHSSTHTEAQSSITDDIWLCNVNGIFIFASWIFGDFLNIILFANSMFDNV